LPAASVSLWSPETTTTLPRSFISMLRTSANEIPRARAHPPRPTIYRPNNSRYPGFSFIFFFFTFTLRIVRPSYWSFSIIRGLVTKRTGDHRTGNRTSVGPETCVHWCTAYVRLPIIFRECFFEMTSNEEGNERYTINELTTCCFRWVP